MKTLLHYYYNQANAMHCLSGKLANAFCCKKMGGNPIKYISILLLLIVCSEQIKGQLPNDNFNRGFEDNISGGNGFWNVWGGTANFQFSSTVRTGNYALSHTVNNTTSQRIEHLNNKIVVGANQYVHSIMWASRNNSAIRNRLGISISNLSDVSFGSLTENTPTSGWTRYSNSRQNTRSISELAYTYFFTYRSSSTGNVIGYYDDFVIYTSNSSTTDIVEPPAPSCLNINATSPTGITLNWVNSTDAGTGATGVQGTLVLRRIGTTGTAPTLNNQGTYTTSAAASDGVRTISGWDIVADLPASATLYTDNNVTASSNYRYTVIHYDLALNYSAGASPINATAAAPSSIFPDISQSIQNLTKGAGGGTFTPGDVIMIKVSFAVPNTITIHNVRTRIYLPPQLTYISNSMAILDNKDTVFNASAAPNGLCSSPFSQPGAASSLTDASSDDRGRYVSGANPYAEIILGELPTSQTNNNLENNSNGYSGGRIRGGATVPLFYGSQTIVVASIRATINATIGSYIPITSESFYSFFEKSPTANLIAYEIDASTNADRFIELVVSDATLPSSYTGRGVNLFNIYNNGTFGGGTNTDGSTLPGNPNSSPNFVLQNITTNNQPNDGNFSVSKNSSTGQLPGTDGSYMIDNGGRVFTHWYVLGDHTGAADQLNGNLAPATADSAGYMMLVNADYVPKRVVSQTVTNLCPGTFYNFKAWFRNVCPSCGVNSNTSSSPNLRYVPSYRRQGVRPNLTFDVNNRAYYTTGPIDTSDKWIQKEFIFTTGVNSGNFDFSIRNNANGGDGNDWAIDDIQILTRGPVASATVSSDPFIDPSPASYCAGQRFKIVGNWIESTGPFSQYDTYQFQWSFGQNGPWVAMHDIGVVPNFNDPFNATGRIDSTVSEPFNDKNKDVYFRIVVATQESNVSLQDAAPCQVTAFSSNVVRIADCILPVRLLKFKAARIGQQVFIQWNTADVNKLKHFVLERSNNGIQFSPLSTILPQQSSRPFEFGYSDKPTQETDRYYYRLKMVHEDGEIIYSSIESVAWKQSVMTVSIQPNPARDFVMLNWSGVRPNQKVQINILSSAGLSLYSEMLTVQQGPSQRIKLPNIPAGLYLLQVTDPSKQFSQTIKLNKL